MVWLALAALNRFLGSARAKRQGGHMNDSIVFPQLEIATAIPVNFTGLMISKPIFHLARLIMTFDMKINCSALVGPRCLEMLRSSSTGVQNSWPLIKRRASWLTMRSSGCFDVQDNCFWVGAGEWKSRTTERLRPFFPRASAPSKKNEKRINIG